MALPTPIRCAGFEPGDRFGNYDRLEILFPELDREDVTEETLIRFLLRNRRQCSALGKHLDEDNSSPHQDLWLRHQCLGVPLLYKKNEGYLKFMNRLRQRLQAAQYLRLVGRSDKLRHQPQSNRQNPI